MEKIPWYLTEDEIDALKMYHCSEYRSNECIGCLYFCTEDKICALDK